MSTATLNESKLKLMMKTAFAEALKEQRALMQEIVGEALEEIALSRAIDQGLRSKPVARGTIYKILEGKR